MEKIKKFLYLMLLMLLMLPLKKLQRAHMAKTVQSTAVTLMLPQQKMTVLMLPFTDKYYMVFKGEK